MTTEEKLQIVQTLIGADTEASDALLAVYLDDAKDAILQRRYPFSRPDGVDVPAAYERIQCRLAARYFLRRGAEGEISHNEDGVNRTYASVNDDDLLSEVIQIARML